MARTLLFTEQRFWSDINQTLVKRPESQGNQLYGIAGASRMIAIQESDIQTIMSLLSVVERHSLLLNKRLSR